MCHDSLLASVMDATVGHEQEAVEGGCKEYHYEFGERVCSIIVLGQSVTGT